MAGCHGRNGRSDRTSCTCKHSTTSLPPRLSSNSLRPTPQALLIYANLWAAIINFHLHQRSIAEQQCETPITALVAYHGRVMKRHSFNYLQTKMELAKAHSLTIIFQCCCSNYLDTNHENVWMTLQNTATLRSQPF